MSYHSNGLGMGFQFDMSAGSGGVSASGSASGSGSGSSGSVPMGPCYGHGGLKSIKYSGVPGGYDAVCNDGFACHNTSDITLPSCSMPSSSGGPPPPPLVGTTYMTPVTMSAPTMGYTLPAAKTGTTPIRIGAGEPTNRPAPLTKAPAAYNVVTGTVTPAKTMGIPGLQYTPPPRLADGVVAGKTQAEQDAYHTRNMILIGLGLLLLAGGGYVVYKKSKE